MNTDWALSDIKELLRYDTSTVDIFSLLFRVKY